MIWCGQDHVANTLANRDPDGARGPRVPVHRRPRRRQDDERAHPGQGAQLHGRSRDDGARPGSRAHHPPCLKCPACLEIAPGTDMDVREIDGASYNGVDEVRKLQDSLPYRPARDRYKIFIVDEVHMLSRARGTPS